MQEIFDFMLNHWVEITLIIVNGISLIIGIVINLIRCFKNNDVLDTISSSAIEAVKTAEHYQIIYGDNVGVLKGKDKLDFAVSLVNEALKIRFPNIDVKRYYRIIVDVIETLLTTPQKKGE